MITNRRWVASAAALWLVLAFAHVSLEWLFQATKISFLSFLGMGERLWVLVLSPLPLVLAGWLLMTLPAAGVLIVLGGDRAAEGKLLGKAARLSLALVPGSLLSFTVFLLVDNFTVTVFGFGVLTQRDSTRLFYGALLLLALAVALLKTSDWIEALAQTPRALRALGRFAAALLALSTVAWLLLPSKSGYTLDSTSMEPLGSAASRHELPDVFLVSAEARPAAEFWFYDHLEPDSAPADGTTRGAVDDEGVSTPVADSMVDPTLRRLVAEGAVFENAFANIDRTAGSVPSVATGRHPLTTQKLNVIHSLRGVDTYRHLPAILKQLGYRTYLSGVTHHVDPAAWNLRGGFDVYNDRPWRPPRFDAWLGAAGGRLDWTAHFLELLWQRIRNRTLHAIGGDLVELPWKPDMSTERTNSVFQGVLELFQQSDDPVFVMAHLRGQDSDFDFYLERLLGQRRRAGAADRDFLLVLWADHGPLHDARWRLPLLVRLPDDAAVDPADLDLSANAQNLDIPPTVLEALGLDPPDWMEGRSLLQRRSRLRPIFIINASDLDEGLPLLGVAEGGPRGIMAMVCQRRWELTFSDGRIQVADLEDHTAPCDEAELPSDGEVHDLLLDFLRQRGVPVELIPSAQP